MRGFFAVLILGAFASSVRADPRLAVMPDRNGQFQITIDDAPAIAEGDNLRLRIDDGADVPVLKLQDQKESLALVVLVSLTSDWLLANEPDEKDVYLRMVRELCHGTIDTVRQALNRPSLQLAGPTGSTATIFGYDREIHLVDGTQPLASLRGDMFSDRSSFKSYEGRALLVGVSVALDRLEASTASSKALLILSDGVDLGGFGIEPERLAARARANHIAIHAIMTAPCSSFARAPVLGALGAQTYQARSTDQFMKAVDSFAKHAPHRYVADFRPGLVRWDGQPHHFELSVNGQFLAATTLTLPAATQPPEPPRPIVDSWMAAVVGGIGLASLVGVAIALLRRRAAREGVVSP